MKDIKGLSIAIDGPSAAGKGTMAKKLAKDLGFIYVDTGAMYRAVGLYILENGIELEDNDRIIASLKEIDVTITYVEGEQRVMLNGRDVSLLIRNEGVAKYASAVSAIPRVRTHLLGMQRQMAQTQNVVMDGRDIGTVVLPNATLKLFLVASLEVRAKRRWLEMEEKGMKMTLAEVRTQIEQRDENDRNRSTAPLKAAKDAVLIDNTAHNIEDAYSFILNLAQERMKDVL